MPLKVELKPGEKLLVGQCIITNSNQRSRLSIEGTAPVLREKDILTPETADTPSKRIYLAVQLMYIDDKIEHVQSSYFTLVNEFVGAAPRSLQIIDRMSTSILAGELYQGLRAAKELIDYEASLSSIGEQR